jgi:hypothetical protein
MAREVDLGWRVSCDRPAVPAAKTDRATSGSTAHGGGDHRVAETTAWRYPTGAAATLTGGQAAGTVMPPENRAGLKQWRGIAALRQGRPQPATTPPAATVRGSWHGRNGTVSFRN